MSSIQPLEQPAAVLVVSNTARRETQTFVARPVDKSVLG